VLAMEHSMSFPARRAALSRPKTLATSPWRFAPSPSCVMQHVELRRVDAGAPFLRENA